MKRAMTLIELSIVTAILGLLMVLLLPAIQSSREQSRASVCRNNLRQIGVALSSFEASHRRFPVGAEGRYDRKLSPVIMFGVSWWADALNYLEQSQVAEELDRRGAHAGWVQLNEHNGKVVDGFAPEMFFCPSSTLEHFVYPGGYRLATPAYIGVSGATNHDDFAELRVSPCCRSDGQISAGGVLIPNAAIRVAQIQDGLSTTLLVAEQSDFAYTSTGLPKRIDGGFVNGWLTGSNAVGIPPNYGSSLSPAYNLATVRYALNERRYELPGIYDDRGANNPLISPHPGVVHLLFCDGSMRQFKDTLPISNLKELATRDDAHLSASNK